MPARVITVCFATACWIAGVLASAAAGRGLIDVFLVGFLALLIGALVGSIAGRLMQWVVDQALEVHKEQHPIPDDEAMGGDGAEEIVV